MRTTDSHPYHGISLTNGHWRIQIRLLDKYRLVRAFAVTAEDAARRHDIMMKRLEMFLPPALEPNFPAEYDAIDMAKWMTDGENLENPMDQSFREMLLQWNEALTKEALQSGWGELKSLASYYHSERQYLKSKADRKKVQERNSRLHHALAALPGVISTLSGQQNWVTKLTKNLEHSELALQQLKGFSEAMDAAQGQLHQYLAEISKSTQQINEKD